MSEATKERNELNTTDLLALVCFLAKYQDDINKMRGTLMAMKDGEELREQLVMQWPVIQGTRNQMNLAKIGEMEFDHTRIGKAVDAILSTNAED